MLKWMIAVLMAVIVMPAICRAQALADKVPADALIYAGWNGTDSLGAGYDGSHLKAVMAASQMAQLFNESVPELFAKLGQRDRDSAADLQLFVDIAGPAFRHPTALYFGGVEVPQGAPPIIKLALLCDAGDDAQALEKNINQAIAQGDPEVQQNVKVKLIDHLLVITTYDFVLPVKALADNATFKSEMAKVTKNPVAAFYADGAAMVAMIDELSKQAPPEAQENWAKIRDGLGLTGLKQVVAAAGFVDKNWAVEAFVDAPAPRTGLLKMLETPPLSPDIMKLIPQDTTLAGASQIDLSKIFDAVKTNLASFNPPASDQFNQAVDQINQAVGFNIDQDLLAAFGTEWAYYTDPDSMGNGLATMAFVNRVRDGQKLESSLTSLEQLANETLKKQIKDSTITLEIKQAKLNGVQVHYWATPVLSPSWAIKNGVLYIGLYPQTVVAATSREDHGKSILDNPAFIDLGKRLDAPKQMSGFQFIDLPKLAPQGYPTVLNLMQTYLGLGDVIGLNAPPLVLPRYSKIAPEINPLGEVIWTDDAGWHMRSISPFPGSSLLASDNSISISSVEAPIMISTLLPSLTRARETADRVKCASNMRQIGQAILLYTNDTKGPYPPDLGTLIKTEDVTAAVFICPSANTKLPTGNLTPQQYADWVNAHSDYIYIGKGLTQGVDPTIVVLYEKAADHNGDGMNMLYGDGHVEFVNMAEAQQQIESSKKAIAELLKK